MVLRAKAEEKKKNGLNFFNAVLFVVSHPGTFKYGTKRIVRVAYGEQFMPTTKQRVKLD